MSKKQPPAPTWNKELLREFFGGKTLALASKSKHDVMPEHLEHWIYLARFARPSQACYPRGE